MPKNSQKNIIGFQNHSTLQMLVRRLICSLQATAATSVLYSSSSASATAGLPLENAKKSVGRKSAAAGPSLQYFMAKANESKVDQKHLASTSESVPYISEEMLQGNGRKGWIDTTGIL